jgi:hypothetical protein
MVHIPDADAGGAVHGVGDGGSRAGDADLADAARAKLAELCIGDVEETCQAQATLWLFTSWLSRLRM